MPIKRYDKVFLSRFKELFARRVAWKEIVETLNEEFFEIYKGSLTRSKLIQLYGQHKDRFQNARNNFLSTLEDKQNQLSLDVLLGSHRATKLLNDRIDKLLDKLESMDPNDEEFDLLLGKLLSIQEIAKKESGLSDKIELKRFLDKARGKAIIDAGFEREKKIIESEQPEETKAKKILGEPASLDELKPAVFSGDLELLEEQEEP